MYWCILCALSQKRRRRQLWLNPQQQPDGTRLVAKRQRDTGLNRNKKRATFLHVKWKCFTGMCALALARFTQRNKLNMLCGLAKSFSHSAPGHSIAPSTGFDTYSTLNCAFANLNLAFHDNWILWRMLCEWFTNVNCLSSGFAILLQISHSK
jgi:hypothetical protein